MDHEKKSKLAAKLSHEVSRQLDALIGSVVMNLDESADEISAKDILAEVVSEATWRYRQLKGDGRHV